MSNLIDRATLKEAVYQEAFEKDSREARWDSGLWIRYKLFERVLDSVPAMPEQKKGKWIGVEADGYADGSLAYDVWECSECGYEHDGEEDTLTPYCPMCGAKMEEETEGSDEE